MLRHGLVKWKRENGKKCGEEGYKKDVPFFPSGRFYLCAYGINNISYIIKTVIHILTNVYTSTLGYYFNGNVTTIL